MANKHLVSEWKKTYKAICESEFADDCDFENFCWGWCMAKGLSMDEAYDFYRAMVDLGMF